MEGGKAGTIRADAVGTQETEETFSLCSFHIQEKKMKKISEFNFFLNLKNTFENSSDH